jgi:hypothetical protein
MRYGAICALAWAPTDVALPARDVLTLHPDPRPLAQIQRFLRKMLKLTDADPLFLFVNNAFCPCPDERIKHLFECFQVSNELEVSYQIAGAWG